MTGDAFCRGGDDSAAPPRKGRGGRVYGFLDGNRGFLGLFWVREGHLISRLRATASRSAPKQSFGLFRCSAWLILHKQSTGLFMEKHSCFRASPLRVNPQGEAKGFLEVRWCVGERMTPAPLPMKGRNAGVYGFLDGNRGYSGGVLSGGDDATSESRDLHLRCAQKEGLECCARVTALRLPLRVYP